MLYTEAFDHYLVYNTKNGGMSCWLIIGETFIWKVNFSFANN